MPLVKPPYSRITAIDLTRGEIRWQVRCDATSEDPLKRAMLDRSCLINIGVDK